MGVRKFAGIAFLALGMAVLSATGFASTCDLTTVASTCTDNNGAIYTQIPPQSTGTGVIDPFLRIQANGTESGYNTSAQGAVLDDKTGIWTHDLSLSDLVPVSVNGVEYFQFNLDINQTNANPLLSLDSVQIYRSGTIYTGTGGDNPPTDPSTLGTLLYSMDFGGSSVILNYNLNPGSGAGDMELLVPESLFSQGSGNYIYLYSSFGGLSTCPSGLNDSEGGSGCRSNDGFEEWYVVRGTEPVPEPATLVLFGTGLVGLGAKLRRRMKKA